MSPRRLLFALLALPLVACGDEGISVRGRLAPGFPAADRVVALESGREASIRDGGFELDGLGASPVSLRFLAGDDTVGLVDLPEVPPGSELELAGLRLDPATRRAFPDAVGGGGDFILVNGVRIGAPPVDGDAEVDGVVLAASDDGTALLLRPREKRSDLRVFLPGMAVVATPDGEVVEGWRTREGDSLRVAGTVADGVLVASRVTLPPAPVYDESSAPPADPVDRAGDGEASSPSSPARPSAAAPPAARDHDRPSRGRGRGKAKGRNRD